MHQRKRQIGGNNIVTLQFRLLVEEDILREGNVKRRRKKNKIKEDEYKQGQKKYYGAEGHHQVHVYWYFLEIVEVDPF